MIIEVDLSHVAAPRDLHEALANSLDFGPYYGYNLSALWDRVTTDVPRPLTLVLTNAAACRTALGPYFEKVINVLEDASRATVHLPPDKQFVLKVVEGVSPSP